MNIGDFKVNTNGWNENPDRLFFNDRPQAERAAIPAVDVRGAGPMPSISRTLKGVLPPDVRVVGKKIRKLSYWIFNVHRWENASFEIEGQFPRHGCDRWLEIENEGWGAFLSRRSKLHFYGAVVLAIMRVFNRALRQGGRRYAIANEIPNSCLELPDNPAYPGDREGALEFLFGKFAKARRHAVEVPDLSKRLPVSFQGDRGYTAEKRKAIWRIEIRLGNRKIPSLTDRRGNPLTGADIGVEYSLASEYMNLPPGNPPLLEDLYPKELIARQRQEQESGIVGLKTGRPRPLDDWSPEVEGNRRLLTALKRCKDPGHDAIEREINSTALEIEIPDGGAFVLQKNRLILFERSGDSLRMYIVKGRENKMSIDDNLTELRN